MKMSYIYLNMQEASLYKKLKSNTVKCTTCSHYCKIIESGTGICAIRQNLKGKLYLLTYGKAFSNIDPIEKKPLFHFLPGSEIFSFGTVGCNFGCLFCQNYYESQISKEIKLKLQQENKLSDLQDEIESFGDDLSPKDIVDYCVKNKIPSIAYTYNEPAIFFEYTYDTAKLAHKKGIKNIYVSNGYESKEAIDKIHPYLDAINIDLKSFSKKFYKNICFARLEPILENIKYYYKIGTWLELTTLIIPGKNDSKEELTQIAKFISSVSNDIPWHVTKFSPCYKMMDVPETPETKLKEAYEIGKKAGLKFVYAGNIFNEKLQSTYCPSCNELLIDRDWTHTRILNLRNGKCAKCGTKIAGIWK